MLTRLLAAAGGTGSVLDVGCSLSADEITYWQDMAALLDPAAYVYALGTSQTFTVTSGESWYLLNGWWLQSASGGSWFHRRLHVFDAQPLPGGTTVTTDSGTNTSGSFYYICKPSLVTGSDTGGPGGSNRYTSDPRALFFERIHRLQYELTHYQIGATRTDTGQTQVSFPTDFTYGFTMHTSIHDVDWLILEATGGGVNMLNELGDASNPVRFTGETWCPFARATFPSIKVQGGGQSEGRAVLTYVKLPSDW